MFKTFEELREEAKEKLNHWMASINYDDRKVTVVSDGYECSSSNCFDMEFVTCDLDMAINYLYPE